MGGLRTEGNLLRLSVAGFGCPVARFGELDSLQEKVKLPCLHYFGAMIKLIKYSCATYALSTNGQNLRTSSRIVTIVLSRKSAYF